MSGTNQRYWTISAKTSWIGDTFREMITYRNLLLRLVRKDLLVSYHQTLLGPLWILLNPLLSVCVYLLVFHRVMGIPTEGIPPVLFYLSGITLYNLFSEILLNTSLSFTANAPVFNKVYFPRLIAPLSIVLTSLFRFCFQLLFLLIASFYYVSLGELVIKPAQLLYALPVITMVAALAFGAGLIFSVITAKYRDLNGLLTHIVRLLMFVCPVFYSLALVPSHLHGLVNLNPLTSQFEMFRYAFFDVGHFMQATLLYSGVVTTLILIGGMLIFNKMGDKLIDVL